ncbi:DUF427 domain-containing protein [Sandaracinus amylolyticus]|uniref:DUF427 domain-containing protein n=1 Tax=Sandaracinus amylolyticus TaxID=927083 RepID=A0A0F6YJF5_9BACT|nr:DUF427 domain-containing protein [Sandaracinus amylolyticus]AKF07757.1 Hypothetical protein DB32_004906 [Sandaracinus amylolyticus]
MKSPGHRKWPDHVVAERTLDQHLRVEIDGEVLADSRDVIEVDEDGAPPRFYFPRSDVVMDKLERTATTTTCPFKGTAHYFRVRTGGKTLDDAVWTYEEPYDEHAALKDRVAFYEGEMPQIRIELAP